MQKNPFILNEIPVNAAFCDREKPIADLISYAHSQTNTVLFSPRRYGKTSIVRRVQEQLKKEKFLTAYCDLFGVTSIEEIAGRITKAIYVITQKNESVFKKAVAFFTSFRPFMVLNEKGEMTVSVQPSFRQAGIEVLDETMAGLEKFIQKVNVPVHIVLDEFQEITEIKGSEAIEGILRGHIQRTKCALVFVGSRRRILLSMFNDRKRPFFQSAINYELKALPLKELTEYITAQFNENGKSISEQFAKKISELLKQHPGYVQKFCFFLFEKADTKVKKDDILDTYRVLLENEKNYFESILQGLSAKQVALLVSAAKEPGGKIYSAEFINRHNLGSTGGIQNSLKVLQNRDIIEKHGDNWGVVDPVFRAWLLKMGI